MPEVLIELKQAKEIVRSAMQMGIHAEIVGIVIDSDNNSAKTAVVNYEAEEQLKKLREQIEERKNKN